MVSGKNDLFSFLEATGVVLGEMEALSVVAALILVLIIDDLNSEMECEEESE